MGLEPNQKAQDKSGVQEVAEVSQEAPGPSQSRQQAISGEFLRLTCILNIRTSVLGLTDNPKTVAWLGQEIATSQRRLRAIEFECAARHWPLPDYSAWKVSGVWPTPS